MREVRSFLVTHGCTGVFSFPGFFAESGFKLSPYVRTRVGLVCGLRYREILNSLNMINNVVLLARSMGRCELPLCRIANVLCQLELLRCDKLFLSPLTNNRPSQF